MPVPLAPRVDDRAAREVAACYLQSADRAGDPLVRSAYDQLSAQTDALLDRVVRAWPAGPLRIAPTALAAPYYDDHELVLGVTTTHALEVPAVDAGRRHPVLGNEPGGPYDRLRALHDLVGHVVPRHGFDRDGEFAAWRVQARLHHGLARWALATELHAQHSVLWTTGALAEPKAVLIDRDVLRRSIELASPRPDPPDADPPPGGSS
jgi:hypothetical protein